LPFHVPMGVLAIIGLSGYFVTSSDSGSFVIDMITSGGMSDPPKAQRVFWALSEGAVTTALLVGGGRDALINIQTVSIASALPFVVLLCIMVYALKAAFDMDDELMAMKEKKDGIEMVSSVSPVAGAGSPEPQKVEKDEPAEKTQKWNIGFFDNVCSKDSMMKILQAFFCPCTLQSRHGTFVGLYAIPPRMDSPTLCADILLASAVFVLPLTIYVMLLLEIWVEGMACLAGVFWLIFIAIGAVHRMNVRRKYNVPGSFPTDFVSFCFCHCLALRQEAAQCVEQSADI